ncbi:MAG: hypothetical protein WBC22_19515 [Sedimentisphaerales bacterium]
MRIENKKTALIITLAVSALVIGLMPWLNKKLVLHDILSNDEGLWAYFWLHGINFCEWGWFLVLFFAIAALVGMRHWKPSTLLLKGIVILFSLSAIALASIWLVVLIVMSRFNW